MEHINIDNHERLSSIGLVCICGKAIATIEGVARRCECGRLWIITAMLIEDKVEVKHEF